MNKFSIAIALLMDSLADAFPEETNYLKLKALLSSKVKDAMQQVLDVANRKE